MRETRLNIAVNAKHSKDIANFSSIQHLHGISTQTGENMFCAQLEAY